METKGFLEHWNLFLFEKYKKIQNITFFNLKTPNRTLHFFNNNNNPNETFISSNNQFGQHRREERCISCWKTNFLVQIINLLLKLPSSSSSQTNGKIIWRSLTQTFFGKSLSSKLDQVANGMQYFQLRKRSRLLYLFGL